VGFFLFPAFEQSVKPVFALERVRHFLYNVRMSIARPPAPAGGHL
jgi:hypothetical protein